MEIYSPDRAEAFPPQFEPAGADTAIPQTPFEEGIGQVRAELGAIRDGYQNRFDEANAELQERSGWGPVRRKLLTVIEVVDPFEPGNGPKYRSRSALSGVDRCDALLDRLDSGDVTVATEYLTSQISDEYLATRLELFISSKNRESKKRSAIDRTRPDIDLLRKIDPKLAERVQESFTRI